MTNFCADFNWPLLVSVGLFELNERCHFSGLASIRLFLNPPKSLSIRCGLQFGNYCISIKSLSVRCSVISIVFNVRIFMNDQCNQMLSKNWKKCTKFITIIRQVKIFKSGSRKICKRQSFKNFTWSILDYLDPDVSSNFSGMTKRQCGALYPFRNPHYLQDDTVSKCRYSCLYIGFSYNLKKFESMLIGLWFVLLVLGIFSVRYPDEIWA